MANKRVEERKATWKFAFFHQPPYTEEPHGAMDEEGHLKEREINAAQKYPFKVDIVFADEDHSYQRGEKGGVIYIVTGGEGAPLYDKARDNPYIQLLRRLITIT